MNNTQRVILGVVTATAISALMVFASTPGAPRALGGAAVVVRGMLMEGDRPFPRALVKFMDFRSATVIAEVTTGPDGSFDAGLDRPGLYQVNIGTLPHLSSTHRFVELAGGENAVQLTLKPTRVQVEILGKTGNPTEPIQVYIHGPSSTTHSERAGVATHPYSASFGLIGFEYGEFVITASGSNGLVSRTPARFTLSPSQPRIGVRLDMATRPLRLKLVGARGEAVVDATVTADARTLPVDPAGFDLSAVPAGQRLYIKADGHLPLCRIIPEEPGTLTLNLQAPGQHDKTVSLLPETDLQLRTPRGLIDGLPGSDCGVPIKLFTVTPLRGASATGQPGAGPSGSLAFTIHGLPAGGYEFRADDFDPAKPFVVPGPTSTYLLPSRCTICGV